MKVFKFGGGVLHSADTVRKIPGILGMFNGEPLIIVVSAFGKTTNSLEDLIQSCFNKDGHSAFLLKKIIDYHAGMLDDLFPDGNHPVYNDIKVYGDELNKIVLSEPIGSFSQFYDQVIVYGELISSRIVSCFLAGQGLENVWIDIRRVLKTDSTFREAVVDWESSQAGADREIRPLLDKQVNKNPLVVTQGFIASDRQGLSTSLGREGSDYTASILASLLDASLVITWKDVPGILNADPKHFHKTVKLDEISYAEATELAYYGAKVIHPKTVKPLQNKGIPMQVRPFDDPLSSGTLIHKNAATESLIPSFIFKFDQVLISVSTRDLSFIDEKVFNDVFGLLSQYAIHMNIIQNSALTLSFCIDNHTNLHALLAGLQVHYSVRYNEALELITIRHFNEKARELVVQGRQVLLEQQNRTVVQYVVR
jgi:aspartate kinase